VLLRGSARERAGRSLRSSSRSARRGGRRLEEEDGWLVTARDGRGAGGGGSDGEEGACRLAGSSKTSLQKGQLVRVFAGLLTVKTYWQEGQVTRVLMAGPLGRPILVWRPAGVRRTVSTMRGRKGAVKSKLERP
jgi:hypothetical protein